jgi:hypothetical protein
MCITFAETIRSQKTTSIEKHSHLESLSASRLPSDMVTISKVISNLLALKMSVTPTTMQALTTRRVDINIGKFFYPSHGEGRIVEDSNDHVDHTGEPHNEHGHP